MKVSNVCILSAQNNLHWNDKNAFKMIIAVIVPGVVVTVVILFLISVMAMLIYRHLNRTRNCCELVQF